MWRRFKARKSRENDRNLQTATTLPYLPDNVIELIISFLPIDQAAYVNTVCKQWAPLWPSFPIIDFDQGNFSRVRFFNLLHSTLRRCRDQKVLGKLSIRAQFDFGHIHTLVNEWIDFAIETCVKELVIQDLDEKKNHYILISHHVLTLKSLTSLNLENVRLYASSGINGPVSLPLLKTMTLKYVRFLDDGDAPGDRAIPSLVEGCPSIEHLLIDTCHLGYSTNVLLIPSDSLKSLEIMHCHSLIIDVTAKNLESFTFYSDCTCRYHKDMYLSECDNLKHVDISCKGLKHILLHNGFDIMENSFHTPNLVSFEFSGYLKTKVHFVEAPSNLLRATIRVWGNSWSIDHYSYLRDFLESFDCSEKVKLHVGNEGIMIPEQCRMEWPAPLPSIKQLQIYLYAPFEDMEYRSRPSLVWMAPSAEILPFLDHDYDEGEWGEEHDEEEEEGEEDEDDDDDNNDDDIDDNEDLL